MAPSLQLGRLPGAPLLAGALTAALFSLSGMPLFAGFFTKFILFQAVASEGFLWLAIIAVIMSFVSLYYYLQVIKELYISEPEEPGRLAVPAGGCPFSAGGAENRTCATDNLTRGPWHTSGSTPFVPTSSSTTPASSRRRWRRPKNSNNSARWRTAGA